jgi:transcriptional regulator with XRE-family HTH domain
MNTFGKYIKTKRLAKGLSLRQFCKNKGLDSAYVSRLENELIPAPSKESLLEALAQSLELKKNTAEWVEFFDLAATSRGEIPKDIQDKFPDVLNLLPAFFRSVEKDSLNEEDIQDLLNLVKSGYDDPEEN